MLTRRHSILLSVKGLAALVAAGPFLAGCAGSLPAPDGEGPDDGPEREPGRSPADAVGEDAIRARTRTDASARSRDAAEADSARPESRDDIGARLDDIGPRELETAADEPMDWASFIVALGTLAEAQFSDDWDQASYVEEVAALMKLLDLEDAYFQSLYDGYVQVLGTFPELATVHEGGHFEVATVEFDAGDAIPLHNHPDMTGVIVCLSGVTRVESFDLLDETSPEGNLLLERVDDLTLTAGDHCTLTAKRGNIHSLVALEFTQLLDVFTPPYDEEKLLRYRWYEREQSPYQGETIFEAWETL